MPNITAIVGSRNITEYELVKGILDNHKIDQIVSGGAKGIDQLAERYSADHLSTTPMIFLPDWAQHGKRAGVMRNSDIIQHSTSVIAIWDGVSKGTLSSIKLAKKFKKELTVYIVKDGIIAKQ